MSTPQSATAKATTSQPQANDMNVMNAGPANGKHAHCENKASRVRGGGAAKDCFLGLVECFICFECCKGCCECCADIFCCPCEMCC